MASRRIVPSSAEAVYLLMPAWSGKQGFQLRLDASVFHRTHGDPTVKALPDAVEEGLRHHIFPVPISRGSDARPASAPGRRAYSARKGHVKALAQSIEMRKCRSLYRRIRSCRPAGGKPTVARPNSESPRLAQKREGVEAAWGCRSAVKSPTRRRRAPSLRRLAHASR
jgi:hypothetical protein